MGNIADFNILLFLPVPHGVHEIHTQINGNSAGGVIGPLGRGLYFREFDVIL